MQSNLALVISEKVIENRWYHNAHEGTTWETSSMREYLNIEFFKRFNQSDKYRIAETIIQNESNPWYNTYGCKNTKDKFFLLSATEVMQYFGGSRLPAKDAYEKPISDMNNSSRAAVGLDGSAAWWWLRTPGYMHSLTAWVTSSGMIDMYGSAVFWSQGAGGGVRPALWLHLGNINLAP